MNEFSPFALLLNAFFLHFTCLILTFSLVTRFSRLSLSTFLSFFLSLSPSQPYLHPFSLNLSNLFLLQSFPSLTISLVENHFLIFPFSRCLSSLCLIISFFPLISSLCLHLYICLSSHFSRVFLPYCLFLSFLVPLLIPVIYFSLVLFLPFSLFLSPRLSLSLSLSLSHSLSWIYCYSAPILSLSLSSCLPVFPIAFFYPPLSFFSVDLLFTLNYLNSKKHLYI